MLGVSLPSSLKLPTLDMQSYEVNGAFGIFQSSINKVAGRMSILGDVATLLVAKHVRILFMEEIRLTTWDV